MSAGTNGAAATGGEGVIPIHDSFIVRASFEGGLRRAVVTAFKEEYGVEPVIRKKRGGGCKTVNGNGAFFT